MPECYITHKSWGQLTTLELYALLKLRTDVFFVEQRIDEEELDNRDQEPTTEHLWIADVTGVAAYLRVLVDDRHYFPAYQAVLLMRRDLSPEAAAALGKLAGSITEERMIAMNATLATIFDGLAVEGKTLVELRARSKPVVGRTPSMIDSRFGSYY